MSKDVSGCIYLSQTAEIDAKKKTRLFAFYINFGYLVYFVLRHKFPHISDRSVSGRKPKQCVKTQDGIIIITL